jgi:hypothetical protein
MFVVLARHGGRLLYLGAEDDDEARWAEQLGGQRIEVGPALVTKPILVGTPRKVDWFVVQLAGLADRSIEVQ